MSKKEWTWKELGQLQFSQEEAETIMGKVADEDDKMEMRAGQLDAEAAIRSAILTMATQGSSPAQKQMLELIEKNKPKKEAKDDFF